MTQPPRLLDRVKSVIHLKYFCANTEKSYLYYIRDFILFHNKRHLREMGIEEIRAYLSHLVVERHVAASTQFAAH
jgi:Phage integrase, N-terminal SAM-like domain